MRNAFLPEADLCCEVQDGILAMQNHFCFAVPSCLRQNKFPREYKSIWIWFPKYLAINHMENHWKSTRRGEMV